jgi:stage II sporulation protein P
MGGERRGMERKVLIILALAGWVLALAIGVAFAWFALWGPGSSRALSQAEPSPSTSATETSGPTATPSATPTPTPTPFPTPPPPDSPVPTPAPPTPTPTPTPTATVTATLVAGADGANVRAGPGTEHDLLGTLDSGATAVVKGSFEDWYLIDYEGTPAWVASWVVEATDLDVPGVDETGAVIATPSGPQPTPTATLVAGEGTPTVTLVAGEAGANVRSGPGTEHDLIGSLDPGDTAVVTGRHEDWYGIDYDGEPGWVAGWVVEVTDGENVPEVEPSEGAESAAEEL